ncbi:MAG: VIT domain-containing protein [Saprospiraceae bacterium]
MTFKYQIIVMCLLFSGLLQAQVTTELTVRNADSWRSGQSTIEAAQFTIHPRGVYMEIGMYLTLSAREAKSVWPNDTIHFEQAQEDLEATLQFNLPTGAMITDSWLWINEDIIQADIEERWHATRVYEEIVGFRRDPSLLVKDNWSWQGDVTADFYHLRVYPLQPDSSRRVKITYLVPGNWQDGSVAVPLPMDILNASKVPVEEIVVQCFLNNDFSNPRPLQSTTQNFTNATHATLGDHFSLSLTPTDIEAGLDILLDVPMQNGVFLSRYEEPTRDYYEAVILPEVALMGEAEKTKKIALLVDYDTTTTTISKDELFAILAQQVLTTLAPQDSFNLIFNSQIGVAPINTNWLSADEATVSTIFNLIEEAYTLSVTTNLPELIDAGIDYMRNNGQKGALLLVSCADQFHEMNAADEYIATLAPKLLDLPEMSIYVADYQNKNQSSDYYYWIEEGDEPRYVERRYYGNEYFYIKLQESVNGNLHVIRQEKSFQNLFYQSLQGISAIRAIDALTITKQEGSCFSEFTLPRPTFSSPNAPILKIGKCVGNLPYTLNFSGRVGTETIHKSIIIDESYLNEGTTNHITAWAGNFISGLELNRAYYGLTQRIIEKIIEWSLEHRVLSLYTAFLALEPAEGGYICEECVDETDHDLLVTNLSGGNQNDSENEVELPDISLGSPVRGEEYSLPLGDSIITATTEIDLATTMEIMASPNPFRTNTTINVKLKTDLSANQLSGSIYDLNGRALKSLIPQRGKTSRDWQFSWDGTDNNEKRLSTGLYIFMVQSEFGQGSYKLVLME